jgi:hypothetical protein
LCRTSRLFPVTKVSIFSLFEVCNFIDLLAPCVRVFFFHPGVDILCHCYIWRRRSRDVLGRVTTRSLVSASSETLSATGCHASTYSHCRVLVQFHHPRRVPNFPPGVVKTDLPHRNRPCSAVGPGLKVGSGCRELGSEAHKVPCTRQWQPVEGTQRATF